MGSDTYLYVLLAAAFVTYVLVDVGIVELPWADRPVDATDSQAPDTGTGHLPIYEPGGSDSGSIDSRISACYGERSQSGTNFDLRRFEWSYDEWEFWWEQGLSRELYECLVDEGVRRGVQAGDYGGFVASKHDDAYLAELAHELEGLASDAGFDEYDTVSMVAAFVQQLEYSTDSETTPYDEWPRFPIETLYHLGGDCEDTAILLASLLEAMGYDAVMFKVPGHMAVGVYAEDNGSFGGVHYEGGFYAYIETTAPGFRIGQVPSEYVGVAPTVLQV